MRRSSALFSVCFCAGLIGALANSLAVWFSGAWGLTALAGVHIAPHLSPTWLYPRLVWGGLWGLAFFFSVGHPRYRCHWVRKGLWVSLLPTAFQLFYVFPARTSFGLLGMGLGALTPLFVLLFNFVWGFFTAVSARLLWGRG